MNIKDIFTDAELALIDSGKYMPGRAVLDAKLDLAAAMEREACAVIADGQLRNTNALLTYPPQSSAAYQIGVAIRNRGKA